ncbi:MAG: NAD(P)H-hydrate dehydratase [Puniceicoccaceae bacterium]
MFPIHSLADARAYEDSILKGQARLTAAAMDNAGRAIGNELLLDYKELGDWPADAHILIFGGKGLNTGDAFVACEAISESVANLRITLVLSADEDSLNPIALEVLQRLKRSQAERMQVISVESFMSQEPATYNVVLDGLYGLGFRPPLRENIADLLKRINGMDSIRLRVSIDLPSGMGEETDPDTFRADLTYIPGVAKAPVFKKTNKEYVGRIRFLEIEPFLDQPTGEDSSPCLASRHAHKSLNRYRDAQSDKRSYGHCLLIAGSTQMPGAALMATMGALQAGAGLVTSCVPMSIMPYIAPRVPEAMWRPLPLTPDGSFDLEAVRIISQSSAKANAILIGPGLIADRATIFALSRIIREIHLPMVLDASALTQDILSAVLGRPLNAGPVILTPHMGEFFRISGAKAETMDDRALLDFSSKYRVTTVLKGNPNLVCDGKRVITVPVGGPLLARGGAGDILSGMVTCLLAQYPDMPVDVAVKAVCWHGAAADSLARESGATAVKTTDLLPHLASSLRA